MSKYKIEVTYGNVIKTFNSDLLESCNEFLWSLPKNLKFDHIEFSYSLVNQKYTTKVIDKATEETLSVIPKEVGTGMMFSLQSILMRNNQL